MNVDKIRFHKCHMQLTKGERWCTGENMLSSPFNWKYIHVISEQVWCVYAFYLNKKTHLHPLRMWMLHLQLLQNDYFIWLHKYMNALNWLKWDGYPWFSAIFERETAMFIGISSFLSSAPISYRKGRKERTCFRGAIFFPFREIIFWQCRLIELRNPSIQNDFIMSLVVISNAGIKRVGFI